jgi:hypothetical protein
MLERGEAYASSLGTSEFPANAEDQLDARRTAIQCTQAMLMGLEPEARIAYVLDVVFGLDSPEAAAVQGIKPAAHRQRLARARGKIETFMASRCGLVSNAAPCRCIRQVPAKRAARAAGRLAVGLRISDAELGAAAEGLRELIAMGDAAEVIRGAPEYAAPESALIGIRQVLERTRILRR